MNGPRWGGECLSQPSGLRAGRPQPTLGARWSFRAALTSATAAFRSAPRAVTGSCRRAQATAAQPGQRRAGGRHRRRRDCASERRVGRRRPGSASDTERTAHAGAVRARAPCWTGGVRTWLKGFSQNGTPSSDSTQSWAASFVTEETTNRNSEVACFT